MKRDDPAPTPVEIELGRFVSLARMSAALMRPKGDAALGQIADALEARATEAAGTLRRAVALRRYQR